MAEDLESGAEVADNGTDVGPCFKAVVLVWISPVPWYSMARVPEFEVDEEFEPCDSTCLPIVVGVSPLLMFQKSVHVLVQFLNVAEPMLSLQRLFGLPMSSSCLLL